MKTFYLKRFNDWIRRFSIKQRLFGFAILPSILMLICFMFYYSFSRSVLLQKSEQASIQLITMAEENLSLNAERLKSKVDNFSEKNSCIQIIQNKTITDAQKQIMERSRNNMESTLIQLYNRQGELIGESGQSNGISNLLHQHKQGWYYEHDIDKMLYISTIIEDDTLIGSVYAYFPKEVFAPLFTEKNSKTNAIQILDENDCILFGQSSLPYQMKIQIDDQMAKINHMEYIVTLRQIEGMDWKIMDMVSSDHVFEEIHNFRNLILVYCLIAMIVLLLCASLTYHSMHDPINAMLSSMQDFREDNLETIKIKDGGRDELHHLSTTFNDLLTRIEELLTTVQREQEQRRETQIQLLQAQINPHFLFNMLNTLRYLAILNEDKPVSEGINALAKLLRNTIVDSNEMVSVQEEIENVKNYIIIQKLRYGDLFETVYNIDENIKQKKILKFLLQPIVENSILHAFEEDREHQILTIRAREKNGYLCIEIGDNGKGFCVEDSVSSNKKLSSIGMKNIQERIQLMYGDTYSMKVESVIDVGTITTLLLPLEN